MKIAIISDTHDNLPNFKKAISFIKKQNIKVIIHCGDVTTPDTLKKGLEDFQGKIHLVWGNVDKDHFKEKKDYSKEFPRIKFWGEKGEINANSKKIAFSHCPKIAHKLAQEEYDLVFYGHTHKPWQEKEGDTELVNPGNLAGIFYKPTFAIYNTKNEKLELKILAKIE